MNDNEQRCVEALEQIRNGMVLLAEVVTGPDGSVRVPAVIAGQLRAMMSELAALSGHIKRSLDRQLDEEPGRDEWRQN